MDLNLCNGDFPPCKLMIVYWTAKCCRVVGVSIPDNVAQKLGNWFGEGIGKGLEMWAREVLQHCK
jgi:hypothetical protein